MASLCQIPVLSIIIIKYGQKRHFLPFHSTTTLMLSHKTSVHGFKLCDYRSVFFFIFSSFLLYVTFDKMKQREWLSNLELEVYLPKKQKTIRKKKWKFSEIIYYQYTFPSQIYNSSVFLVECNVQMGNVQMAKIERSNDDKNTIKRCKISIIFNLVKMWFNRMVERFPKYGIQMQKSTA